MTDPPNRMPPARARWFGRPGLAALVGIAVMGLWSLRWPMMLAGDADLATHTHVGRELLANGWPDRVPILQGEGTAWSEPIVVSEWGFDVLMASLQGLLGWGGPLFAGLALGGLVFGGLAARIRAGGAGAWTLLVALFVAFTMSAHHVTTRPHLFTWALLVPFGAWWRAWAVGGLSSRALAIRSAPLAALWANLHGGFLAGLLYAGTLVVGARSERRMQGIGLLGLTLLATCLNPWGPVLWLDLWRFLSDSFVTMGTSDFQPFAPEVQAALAAVLAFAGWGHLRDPQRERVDLLPLLVFGAAALVSSRNAPVAALVLTAPAALAWARVTAFEAGRGRRWAREWHASEERLGGGGAFDGFGWTGIVALAVVIGLVSTGRVGHELPSHLAPRDAWAAVSEPGEHVFTDFKHGGFVASWGGRPFVHPLNLLYPRERLEEYVVVNQGQPGWREVLSKHDIRWLLLAPDSPLVDRLGRESDCRIHHQDPIAVVATCEIRSRK